MPGRQAVGVHILENVRSFNGTSTPKGSYRAETGDNDSNVNSSRYVQSKNCTV